MSLEKAKEWGGAVSGIVLGVSALHVVCASVYLYFYCVGFGANISMFFSAPDIFSISITKLAGVYLRSLIWPVMIYSALRLLRVKNQHAWIEAAPSAEGAEGRVKRIRAGVLALSILIYAMLAAISANGIFDLWRGRPTVVYSLMSSLSLAVVMTVILQRGYTPRWLGLGAFFISGVIGGALDNGQSDRHATYASYRSLPSCNGFRVLARASGHYVAIGNQGTKVLIKEDCKVAFVFPDPKIK